MKAFLLFGTLGLGSCLVGQAQNLTGGTLQVTGTARIGNTTWLSSHLIFNSGGPANPGNDDWVIENNHFGQLRILNNWNSNFNVVTFSSDGVNFSQRVSIGNVSCPPGLTCANTWALAVGGPIAAQGKITVINYGGAWPDYVFQPAYRLRPLPEVGRFIRANHHLPDVPSAAQVQANGVELAEMNAVLLRKVEELTLYLLELQAANQALTERVARLETTK